MDSPGVVLASKDQTDSLILRSAIKVEDLPDPMRPVEALLNRIEKQELLVHYRIADFDNIDSFIGQVARKKGFLQNKGVPNVDQTARAVIRDYMQGKLKYFTAPPEFDDDVMDEDMQ
jgi:nuclear GTP-binding protein